MEKRTGVQLTTRQATTLKYAVLGRHIDSEMDNRDNVAEVLVDIVLMPIALSQERIRCLVAVTVGCGQYGVVGAWDLTDRTVLERYGQIDGLINKDDASLYARLDELDLEEFTRMLALNAVSVVALPSVGAYGATKSALNMLTSVSRKELEADAIAVSLVLPSLTATEFGGGRHQPSQQARPGMIAHSPECVAQVILRALRTGEECVDIPHGAEQPQLTTAPSN